LYLKGIAKRGFINAVAFALYLPGLEMTLSYQLYSEETGERQMLFEHLNHLKTDDLLVLDRGFPAIWLLAYLAQHNILFCTRVDNTGFVGVKSFLRSGLAEQRITLKAPNAKDCQDYECKRIPTEVRLVKVVTPGGKIHVLMTSLLDSAKYPAGDFAALYHGRWRIEEAFKRLKHRLALENTSGLSWLAANQDFGAKILADNLHALSVLEAENTFEINEGYKINRTYAFAHLKCCLAR